MRITKIELVNFKRFSHLEISNIPELSKLVVVIGSNGSGKSSLFDAFGFVDAAIKQDIKPKEPFWDYFRKRKGFPIEVSLFVDEGSPFIVSDRKFRIPVVRKYESPVDSTRSFYGRSSFRQVSRLTRTSLGQGGQVDLEKDSDRPKFFIDRDNRFENDIEKVTETILRDFFRLKQSNEEILRNYISPINGALQRIFGEGNGTKLRLIEIIPPLEGKVAQIIFQKGKSEIHYNYLSAGEKEVFNLLINLLSRASLYEDTIYYLDEIDLHLNTKLQFNLIKEITETWIPHRSQLWTATHSLGFIEYAKQSDHASILDFGDLNFDLPQTLVPEAKDNPDVYEIAVGKDFLPSLFQHLAVYFVENKDQDYYASVGIPSTVFVSANDRNSVYRKVRTSEFNGIVDRDFLSDDDIQQIRQQYPKLRILNYYSVENYMYHPDNLAEYFQKTGKEFNKLDYIQQLAKAKNEVKDSLILRIASVRSSYPYFEEPDFNGKPLQKRFRSSQENFDQTAAVQGYLNSDDLETFYKSLPMKDYGKHIPQRQNIAKTDLVKTAWFKIQITALLA